MTRSSAGARFVRELGAEPVPGRVEELASWRAAAGSDAIIHAAAIVTVAAPWDEYHRINVTGTMHATETAIAHDSRLIHVSSVAVYGRRLVSGRGRITEDTEPGPIAMADYYARSKRGAEDFLWRGTRTRGLSAIALRPCVIYGERERLFMSRLLALLRHGVAPLVGNGGNALAMVYVGNVIDAMMSALERPSVTGPFNTCNDGGLTQREFYQTVAEETGRTIRLFRVPVSVAMAAGGAWRCAFRLLKPGRYTSLGASSARFMARDNPYSSERTMRTLGWRPSVDPHAALRQTIRWFVAQGHGGSD
jgi:nucleoside-diphosphate-sugar epimerase